MRDMHGSRASAPETAQHGNHGHTLMVHQEADLPFKTRHHRGRSSPAGGVLHPL
jgi:hypothetical protein